MPPPTPAGSSSDRNLLFGILAVQMDFVSRDALIAAMNAWVLTKSRPLGEILQEQGALSPAQRQALDLVEAEHLKAHGSDVQRSLAAVAFPSTVDDALQSVSDPDVRRSVAAAGGPGATTAERRDVDGARYKVLRPHARGGLGLVSVARDVELGREVALKEIQAESAADELNQGRFVREAEITGSLEHPGIVPVYGMGRYSDGRPYYAMRLIRGESLQEALRKLHAGEEGYTLRELLTRFVGVCNAVAYAHSRGVIHRDLKPANVMLGSYGETLVVDWGLAKVIGRSPLGGEGAAEVTLRPASGDNSGTQAGATLGTPAFMSPEQARGDVVALGPATDVYSLGATLYTVLTGQAPIRGNTADVLEKVRQGNWPSPRQVKPSVPAALDATCCKAMALKPADRYVQALALAAEVEHWLADEPVTAYHESLAARAGRWARRHRVAVVGAAVAAVVGLLSLGTTTLLLTAANTRERAARQAEAERAEGERLARDSAEKRLTQLEKGNNILGSIFRELDPWAEEKEGKTLRVLLGEHLDKAAEELAGDAVGDPLVVAKLQLTLGESLLGLGLPDKATGLLTRSRATYTTELGPEHPDTLASMSGLAEALGATGKRELALPLLEEVFRLRKARLGPEHPDSLTSMNSLGMGYLDAGKLVLAVPLLEEALRLRRKNLGPEHPDTLTSTDSLAVAFRDAGKVEQALPLFVEVLRLRKVKLGPERPATLTSMNNLAAAYRSAGKLDLAIPLYVEALGLRKAKLGPEHPDTLSSMDNLAVAYWKAGNLGLAVPLFEEAFKLYKAKLGPEHPDTLISMSNLAGAYRDAEKLEQSQALLEEALKLETAKLGPEHPDTIITMHNLAKAYQAAGKLDRALPLYEQTFKLLKAQRGLEHPNTLISMNSLAGAYRQGGNPGRALPLLEEALRLTKAKRGPEHPDTLRTASALGSTLLQAGKPGEAEEVLRGCWVILQSKRPEDWITFEAQSLVGAALLGQKKYAEAGPLLLSGYEGMKRREANIPARDKTRLTEAIEQLVKLYDALGETDKAAAWRQKLPTAKDARPAGLKETRQ